jgi:low temperature requirement protein LtrA
VAGVVLGAVGSELTIAHPSHHASYVEAAIIIGAVALFLFGNGLFKWVSAPNFPLSHMVGIGLCAVVMAGAGFMTLVSLNSLAALILVVVAVWEQRSFASGPVEA